MIKYSSIFLLMILSACSDNSKNVDNLPLDSFESTLKIANEIRAKIIMANITPYEHDNIIILSKRLKDMSEMNTSGKSAEHIILRTFKDIYYKEYGDGFLDNLATSMRKDLIDRCSLNQAEDRFSERSKKFIMANALGLDLLNESLNDHPDTLLFKKVLEHKRSEELARKQLQEAQRKEREAAAATQNAVANGVIAGRMISKMFGF